MPESIGRFPTTVVELDVRQDIGAGFTDITYKFCSKGIVLAGYIPCLESVSTQPQTLGLAEGLGMRERVRITLLDFVEDQDVQGTAAATPTTFWRLMKARVQWFNNRAVRVKRGFIVDGAFVTDRTYTYVSTTLSGPDRDNRAVLECKDQLHLTINKKAQAPKVGTGKLFVGISAAATSATIDSSTAAAEYGTSGYLRMGDSNEVMAFTRSGQTLTLTRASLGTTATTHAAGDTIQEVLYYSGAKIDDVVYALLTTYAGIDPSYIDASAWSTENDRWVPFSVSTLIWEPTGVEELLSELTEQFPVVLWYDPTGPTFNYRGTLSFAFLDPNEINERQHIRADSQEITEDPEQAYTQIWFYYGVKDYSEALDEPANFASLTAFINSDAESVNKRNEKRIKKVFSRWLLSTQNLDVLSIGVRMQRVLQHDVRIWAAEIDAKDAFLSVGDLLEVTTSRIVSTTGAEDPTKMVVISIKEAVEGSRYDISARDLRIAGRPRLWCPSGIPVYDSQTQAQKDKYLTYCDAGETLGAANDPAHTWL